MATKHKKPPNSICENLISFSEATQFDEKGVARIRIMKPGFNLSKGRFYPADVLKRDGHMFEGVKMYANHQTARQRRDRPEGDVHDFVGVLRNVEANKEGELFGDAHLIDDGFKSKVRNLKEAGLLAQMGTSIRAFGKVSQRTVQGVKTQMLEAFTKAESVDFVTNAGAGGEVQMFESERDEIFIDEMSLEDLQTARPDLIEAAQKLKTGDNPMTEEEKERLTKIEESLKTQDAKLTEETKLREAAEKERDELKTKVEESDKVAARATHKEALDKVLKEATEAKEAPLSEACAKHIKGIYEDADDLDSIKEAITSFKALELELKTPGKVSSHGQHTQECDQGDAAKGLYQSQKQQYINEGKSPEDADNMARSFSGYKE